jgi:hypothetical protein
VQPPALPEAAKYKTEGSLESSRSGASLMRKLVSLLAKMKQDDRKLILLLAEFPKSKAAGKHDGNPFRILLHRRWNRLPSQLMEDACVCFPFSS